MNIIYHGSNNIVSKPKILTNGYYKDFGYGFYCTNIKNQAIRWALAKRGKHIVNEFEYEPAGNLKILSFGKMTDEWLDFVTDCRRGIAHSYDIVEGAMADDTIWNYIEDFIAGNISRSAFWELVKFKYPTHQIAFCSEKALQCLTFKGSNEV